MRGGKNEGGHKGDDGEGGGDGECGGDEGSEQFECKIHYLSKLDSWIMTALKFMMSEKSCGESKQICGHFPNAYSYCHVKAVCQMVKFHH